MHFHHGEFDNQNRVFGGQAQQRYQTNLEINVIGKVAEIHRHQGTKQAKRQGQQHRQRQRPLFILGRQDQEDHEEASAQRQGTGATAALLLEGRTAPVVTHVRRQHLCRDTFHRSNCLTRAVTGLGFTQNLDRRQRIEVLYRLRTGHKLHIGHGADLNHLAAAGTHIQLANIVGLGAETAFGLHQHLINASALVEVVHIVAAQSSRQCVVNIGQRDAHGARFFGVYIHIELG